MNYILMRVVRRVINDLQGQFTPTTNDIINNKSQLIGRCACTDSERLAFVDPVFVLALHFIRISAEVRVSDQMSSFSYAPHSTGRIR